VSAENNLKSVDVRFHSARWWRSRARRLGKSTLVNDILYKALWKRLVDTRTLPGATSAWTAPRTFTGHQHRPVANRTEQAASNPATVHRFSITIRDLFTPVAALGGARYKAGRFSFNVKGAGARSVRARA